MVKTKEQQKDLTSAQYEVVNVLSCLHSTKDVMALKALLVQFLNERLQSELDGLYDSHSISDATFVELGKQHLRTPYIVTNDAHFDCLADIPFPHVSVRNIDAFLEEPLEMDAGEL